MSNLTLLSDDQAEALAGGAFFLASPISLTGTFSYSSVKANSTVTSTQGSFNNSQAAILAIAGAIQTNNSLISSSASATVAAV
jgi:hypothetical protein